VDRRRILLVVAVVVAALGAVLVFLYAQDAEDRAAEKFAASPVLVATQQINPGESASDAFNAGKLLSQDVPADQQVAGSTNDGTAFLDTVALTTIYPGEQLITQKFGTVEDIESAATLPLPKGMVGKAIVLDDSSRISGFTKPGTRVGMLITGTFPPSTEPETRLLLDQVTILATGLTTITPTNSDGTVNPDSAPLSQYVLALKPRDAARLELAQTFGKISLVLLEADTDLKIGDAITSETLFGE